MHSDRVFDTVAFIAFGACSVFVIAIYFGLFSSGSNSAHENSTCCTCSDQCCSKGAKCSCMNDASITATPNTTSCTTTRTAVEATQHAEDEMEIRPHRFTKKVPGGAKR